jgi:tRNA threonylcarbamoyladenosine biosynthesis protein TsaB
MILAIDASTSWLSLALYEESEVLYECTWKTQRRHTVELAPAVEKAMLDCALTFEQIHALAIALGPGSFTSLRIGLVFIKGLALAYHLPVIGIPTLDILAYSQPIRDLPLICALQAGRGKLAVATYKNGDNHWICESPVQVMTAKDLVFQINSPTLVSGEFTEEDRRTLSRKWKSVILASPANCVRRPACLAEIAMQRWKTGKIDDPATMTPIYLHTTDPILS